MVQKFIVEITYETIYTNNGRKLRIQRFSGIYRNGIFKPIGFLYATIEEFLSISLF